MRPCVTSDSSTELLVRSSESPVQGDEMAEPKSTVIIKLVTADFSNPVFPLETLAVSSATGSLPTSLRIMILCSCVSDCSQRKCPPSRQE